jgi:hypothetical protein
MNVEVWWLKLKRKRTAKFYGKLIVKAKNREDEESLISEAMNERDLIDDKILYLRSMDVQERAIDAGLPVPPHSDKAAWQEGLNPATTRLSPQAQLELNRLIRADKRDRWGMLAFIVKEVAAPLIGVVGGNYGTLVPASLLFPRTTKVAHYLPV